MTSVSANPREHRPNPFLERLKEGPVPVPPGGLPAADKHGFGALYQHGLVRVLEREGRTFLELGKGNFYENANQAQQATLDRIDERIHSFADLELRAASASLVTSAEAHFTSFEIAPGVREIPLALLQPLLGGYDGAAEKTRIANLAADIRESGEIEPIFVGLDANGELYVMEGQHRCRAIVLLGYTAVPARVTVDLDDPALTLTASPGSQ